MLAAKPQKILHGFENLLLPGSATTFAKCVLCVAGPSAGKIPPVVWIAASLHGDFISVVELRNSPQRQDQAKGAEKPFRRTARLAGEARHVVIRKKRNQPVWVRIECVLPQDVCDAACGRPMQQHIAEGKVHREIEYGGNTGVDAVPTFPPACEKGCHCRIGMKDFADGGEIWIDAAQASMPLFPERPRNVGKGIDAQAVDASRFDPPDGILQKILCDHWILGIHVRQNSEKPAVGEIAPHRGSAVWIG